MDTGASDKLRLDGLCHRLSVFGEELDGVLRGLVGAQQAVLRLVAAAVDGLVHDIAQGQYLFGAGLQQTLSGPLPFVDVGTEDRVRIGKNGCGVVGKDDLGFGSLLLDEAAVVFHIVDPGEGVLGFTEQFDELSFRQSRGIGVDAGIQQRILVHQMVPFLVGRVGQQHHHFFDAPGDATEADRKAIAAQNGKDHAHGVAELSLHVGSDIVRGAVVAVGPGHHGLGHGHHIPIMKGKMLLLRRLQHRVHDDGDDVVSLANDRGPNAP